ncbi:MAG TPA: ATP-dependent RNA helicase HrpA [Mycobacteriales bacterium]|nr:ATP-dependent RNA helicase HrpA [Mycobacteriales bacterium]
METSPVITSLGDLQARLPDLLNRDRQRLRRRLDGLPKMRDPAKKQQILDAVSRDLDAAEHRVTHRRASVPKIDYPAALPVSQKKDDILAAIRDHQVVIVAGETGSGKTTQIPKICLELGRGIHGLIGHTQPRRLAARTVAERIAEELRTPLGSAVGYKVRFTDQVSEDTLVKLMTDGILLAEIQSDRQLRQYDTIIIDEAHERSLNVDFLIGYLKQLLPRRPDLKVIITSATIDPQRFSRHFGDAPIIEVSGRTFPVEVRYRPIVDPDDPESDPDRDQTQAIGDAVDELCAEGAGDILVFLSGEREIRDTADALSKQDLGTTEILPLYSRLSAAEQHRVFQQHATRRVVLATNVAETSLTVPGIKYVIDPGTARISRYSHRTKVQRLPIEAISQASANQRKGRCGRVSNGICIRLYSEEDFESRPEFTDPEILRTNLASVILQMAAAGLGDMAGFPFVDPPDRRNIKDGVQLLEELGALDPAEKDLRKRLTPAGRKLAQLPVDPRLARMVLEADNNGCTREVMVIAAALSIQDPRERPAEKQQAADEKHRRFTDKDSDFLAFLNLWNYLREQQKELSSNRFRKLCRAEYLNYLRVREWQDIYSQLRQTAKTMGITLNSNPAEPQHVHIALLSGLLSHIGVKEGTKNDYLGARGARFAVFPGSGLFKKPPRFVMAAELVETSRLWGRVAARIEPEWVEPLAGHLLKHSYSEPHWEKKQAAVMALERVTLYGVPIVTSRKINYGRIEPEVARDLFIRNALVEGDWQTHHPFFHDNRALLAEVEDLEHRTRRRDILVDEETLFEFYDKRIPADVVSGRHFDSWWKKQRREQPDRLTFEKEMLTNDGSGEVSKDDYPDFWAQGNLRLKLSYQFEPGTQRDGVTVDIPLEVLNQVDADDFSWQIPGLRTELVTALLRSLPKPIRRHFVPVPDFARDLVAGLSNRDAPLLETLSREIRQHDGVTVPRDAWDVDRVPDHLKITFRVVNEKGAVLEEGKDLAVLADRLAPKVQETVSAAVEGVEQRGLRTWTVGPLPASVQQQRGAFVVTGYPALADAGDSVDVRVFGTQHDAERAMLAGTRRLLLLNLPSPIKYLLGRLTSRAKLALSTNPYGSAADLLDDCVSCALDGIVAANGGPPADAAAFDRLLTTARAQVNPVSAEALDAVQQTLAAAQRVEVRLAGPPAAVADMRAQLDGLIHRGFISAAGLSRLGDLPRYLQAIEQRLDKLPANPQRDRDWMLRVQAVQQSYQDLIDQMPADHPAIMRIRWMIEELRVSYFAQTLGTPIPVSDKRIYRAIDDLLL